MSMQSWQEVYINSIVDGPTLTAAARATCIPPAARFTFPANFFTIGKMIKVSWQGRVSTVITTPGTIRFDICLGASGTTIVFDSLAILPATAAARTTVPFLCEVWLTCRAQGSGTTANLFGEGTYTSSDLIGSPVDVSGGVGVAFMPWNSAPAVGAGFDSTIANTMDLFFTQTVTTGSVIVHQFKVESLN